MKEYEITITPEKGDALKLGTDKRSIARNVKLACAENNIACEVSRTAKKEVKFAGME